MSKHIYTTAQGKQIDIEGLRLANEETIAVGNMKVNARGDKLGAGGQIAETRNQSQDSYYRLNSQVAQDFTNQENQQIMQQQKASGAQMTQGMPMPDPEPEQQVAEVAPVVETEPEVPVAPKAELRGSLASSIAAPVTHKQPILKDPRKASGPSRI
jgi:hypothetical protein